VQTIPLDQVPIGGAVDRDVTAEGIVLRRSLGALRHQLDPWLARLVIMPAGVRIAMLTDARDLELDVMVSVLDVGEVMAFPAVFDLVVGGELRCSVTAAEATRLVIDPTTRDTHVVPGKPTTIRFDDLPGDASLRVEVWLPHRSLVELRAVRVNDGASLRPPPRRRRWVHYGSSISHCLEVDHPTAAWPAIAARCAEVDLVNLAVAGQCMLDQHVARTIRDLDVDLISIKAGVNIVGDGVMKERSFIPALHGFLDTVRDGHRHAPIVVATPIICPKLDDAGAAPDGLTMDRVRALVGDIVKARRAAGDAQLHLLDGMALFGPGDVEDLPDGLHPNGAGYRRIGERFHQLVFRPDGPFDARG
jgi:GDSL-like Lipase/Acylhydrolase family